MPSTTEQQLTRALAAPAADLCPTCSGQPCLRACPVGSGYAYAEEHAAFPMQAFAARHGTLTDAGEGTFA
jgi:hypothetical protein